MTADANSGDWTDEPFEFEVGGVRHRAHQDGTIEREQDGSWVVLPPKKAKIAFDAFLDQE